MFVAAGIGVRLAVRRVSLDDAWAVALAGVAGGFVGARLFHVIDHWAEYARDPVTILHFQQGGASVVGGLIVGIAAGAAVAFARRPRLAPYGLDCATVGIPFGMAVGRLGDLINGEHWAVACTGLPWCVRYTSPNSPGQREFVHPAVGYELVGDLAIGALMAWLFARGKTGDGRLLATWLLLYGTLRFAVTFLRIDAPIAFLGLAQAQWLALGFILAGGFALARRNSS